MFTVTTSWDDGDVLDLKVAGLLDRYGMKGTFYVTKEYRKERLTEGQIRNLGEKHEVGAHTLTHPDLRTLSREEKSKEIKGSKEWLEQVTGKSVPMFCYPSGRFDAETVEVVKEAGFEGARTVRPSDMFLPARAYEMGTTLHIYPFPFRKTHKGGYYWRYLFEPLLQRYSWYRKLGVSPFRMTSWQSAARAAVDYAYAHGVMFHLWGHSWEIENYGLWEELDRLLAYIASKQNVQFVTNGELARIGLENMLALGGEASWIIVPKGLNEQSIVYSFGAGMDISWDIALIEQYGLTVHAFDPSERSIAWVETQQLPPQFKFYHSGVSDHDGIDSFYPPPNPKNVSYSTVRKVGVPVALPVKRLESIMQELGHSRIDILKLDIEGGEYAVIDDMLAANILPTQLLIEFHDRFAGSRKKAQTLKKLQKRGYVILYESQGGEEYTLLWA